MATAGPRYPGTVATEVGPSGANDWLTASNIGADDGSEAQITHATYDAGDHSYRLIASNFGFDADIPAGSTINGITVEIDRRCFAGAAQDQEVRLYDSTATLVGDDKQTADAWPATLAIATYGGAADTWTAGLDSTDIRSTGFGVALIVLADAANTDIGVDFIRVTVDYTAPAPSGTGAISAPAATVDGAGVEVFTATGAVSVPAATVDGIGAEAFTATGALTVPAATVDGTGAEVFTATGALNVPPPAVAGTGDHTEGSVNPDGSGATSVPAATVAGSGELIFTATGAVSVPPPAVSGSGEELITGSGSITVPAVLAVGSGALVLVGTGAVTVPAATITGAGDHSVGGPTHTATGAVNAPAATVVGVGLAITTGGLPPVSQAFHAVPAVLARHPIPGR